MSVQNIIFIGEVFQIEISDFLVHPPGSRQNINLYPAWLFIGTQVFYALEILMITRFITQN